MSGGMVEVVYTRSAEDGIRQGSVAGTLYVLYDGQTLFVPYGCC